MATQFRCFALVGLSSAHHPSSLARLWPLPPGWPRRQQRWGAMAHSGARPPAWWPASLPGPLWPRWGGHPLGFLYTTLFLKGLVSLRKVSLVPARGSHDRGDSRAAATQPLRRPPPEESPASAVPVLPHEWNDARRGPGQFEKWVSQQFLCCGSLQGLPH